MLLADDVLSAAGQPLDDQGLVAGSPPSAPGLLLAVSAGDGTVLAEDPLESPPVFDGLAAASGCLFVSLENGNVVSMVSSE